MRKRKYRQAAACFLTAALVLSAGPVQSVLAETEASSETIQQEIPEEESTVTVTPGTEVSEETEPQTVPLTEQNTETATETQTGTETQTEQETGILSESEGESENQIRESEAVTKPQESMTEEESGSGAEGDESVSEGETPQEPVEEEPETKVTEETTIPAETPAPVTNAVLRAGSTEQTESSVAKVEMNGTVTYYDNLNEAVHAISDVRGTGTITLLGNASLTGWIASVIEGNITLIGGDYTITGDGAAVYSMNIMSGNFDFSLYSYGTLNIYGGNFLSVDASYGTVNVYGGTIEYQWGNINFYYTAPEPTFTTTQTADSITVEVTNYQDVYGEIQYKWDNGEWGTNNTLPNLGANSEHTVSVRYMGQNNYQPSKETQPQTVRSAPATFTITIPASVTATCYDKPEVGGTISVDKSKAFDLGYNGKVVIYGSYRTMGIDLYRQNDPQGNYLNCDIYTEEKDSGETHVGPSVTHNKTPVAIFDESVYTTDINVYAQIYYSSDQYVPAGTYSGTTTFTAEYTEDPSVDYEVEVPA